MTKPSTIPPTINAAHNAIDFQLLRQAPTLIVAAVTTSTGSVVSSGTAIAEMAKTIAAKTIPTPVPTIKKPSPRGVSSKFETNTSSGGMGCGPKNSMKSRNAISTHAR